MKILRITVHSFILTLINIFAILFGFAIYTMLRPVNQIAVQVPAALLANIAGFLVWWAVTQRVPFRWIALQRRGDFLWVYLAALLWNPLIFIPLHFVTQGYLTSFANILNFWLFQLPANLAALIPAWIIARRKPAFISGPQASSH